MLGIRKATEAVSQSADAVTDLSNVAMGELSDLSSLVRSKAQYVPLIVAGTAVIAVVALIVSLVAISRD